MNDKSLLTQLEKQLYLKITQIVKPPQGMDSDVFFITDSNKREYVIKNSHSVQNEILAYQLLETNKIQIPIPKLYGTFVYEGKPILILEKIPFPLLESIPNGRLPLYIPSMILNLKKIHQVASSVAKHLNRPNTKSWKDILLAKFDGSNKLLNWQNIAHRPGLDTNLILNSVQKLISVIHNTDLPTHHYSLIHTDFNQRNLFADPESEQITGIIDWGEALFGDPIFDFARIRLFILHFNLGSQTLFDYEKRVALNEGEKDRERLYMYSIILEYLAYYSEELNDFNRGRIEMHQKLLQDDFLQ